MMKQPAGNTNATPVDEQESIHRARPVRDAAEDYKAIEEEARRLRLERGAEICTPEEWSRAAEIARNRKNSMSKA